MKIIPYGKAWRLFFRLKIELQKVVYKLFFYLSIAGETYVCFHNTM